MKKILLFARTKNRDWQLFHQEAKNLDIDLCVAYYSEVKISFSSTVEIEVQGQNIESFDLVYFETVGEFVETATLIAFWCLSKHIPIVDTVRHSQKPWIDSKSMEYMRLYAENLPVIPSLYTTANQIDEKSLETFGFPCVIKVPTVDRGEGVFLCHDQNELQKYQDQLGEQVVLVQPFIENDGDIRVFIIGETVVAAMKRKSGSPDEFRNNASLGGTSEKYELSDSMKTVAIHAAKAMEYQIAGVDLIFDKNSQDYKIMEVNISPQFSSLMRVTGVNIPQEICKYLLSKAR